MFVLQLRQNINIGLLFSYMKHAHEYTNTHQKTHRYREHTHKHIYTCTQTFIYNHLETHYT